MTFCFIHQTQTSNAVCVIVRIRIELLAPSGAQEMPMSVHPVQVSRALNLSLFLAALSYFSAISLRQMEPKILCLDNGVWMDND